jgi:hypothetical protein
MIIWLASYPKSGNTWIRSIISLLLFSKDGKMENFNLLSSIEQYPTKKYFFDLVKDYNDPIQIQKNWIPSQNIINRDKKIKFFKTHHIFCKYGDNAFTNSSNTLGVIHIVRDPRNLISSIKHHWSLETLEDAKNKIFDEQTMTGINIEINKEYSFPVMISSWNNHYNAWKKISKNYLLIKYEDLIDDFEKELNRIIIYINNIKKLDIDKIKINNILKTTTFDNFKKMENKGLFNESNFDPKTNQFKTFFNTRPNKNTSQLISKNIKNEIEKKFYNEMKELNYL